MRDFWKKYKLWLSIVICLSLTAVSFFFVVSPLLGDIQEKSDEIQKIKIDNEISQERIAKLPEMRELHAIFGQEKDNLIVVLDQNSSVEFIKKLELLAQETGNSIGLKIDDRSESIKNNKGNDAKKDSEDISANLPSKSYLSMEIDLEGKYENFVSFLYKLENLDYYVNILSISLIKETVDQSASHDELNVKRKEEATGESILVSKLKVVVYTKE
jgi:Tfp pilus assembly protein PilO